MKTKNLTIRQEQDSLGHVEVPANAYFGAQTQRAVQNFIIGSEAMPIEIIYAIATVKKAAAIVNHQCGIFATKKANLIINAADEVISGKLNKHFPLSIWQSGSGTQTNMNVNEVIANRANELAGSALGSNTPIHPNDDVNKSQSTNDVFPTAMHIAAYKLIHEQLLPAIDELKQQLQTKQKTFVHIIKIGRTHLQDAVPLTLAQEFSGYIAQLETCIATINFALTQLQELAIGGTAVGTGINTPANFSLQITKVLSDLTGYKLQSAVNKFSALAGHEAIVTTSSALKNIACALFKIANDIRWLASGPRCGLGELILPENEPGSSIMPGKVNPTQCEMVTMVCAQIIGNDAAITFAASQGHFELNVFKPVIANNLLQSIKLLAAACSNFAQYAIKDLKANEKKIAEYLDKSLMLVTALVPKIGYDKAAKIAQYALKNDLTLREAAIQSGDIAATDFDLAIKNTLDLLHNIE